MDTGRSVKRRNIFPGGSECGPCLFLGSHALLEWISKPRTQLQDRVRTVTTNLLNIQSWKPVVFRLRSESCDEYENNRKNDIQFGHRSSPPQADWPSLTASAMATTCSSRHTNSQGSETRDWRLRMRSFRDLTIAFPAERSVAARSTDFPLHDRPDEDSVCRVTSGHCGDPCRAGWTKTPTPDK